MSRQPLNEIRIDEAEMSEIPLWLNKLVTQEVKEPERTKTKRPIPMVWCPRIEGCYNPEVVSIGPYHYSDRDGKLSNVEKLKAPMTRQFVETCGRTMLELYKDVKRVAQQAKTFYYEIFINDFNPEEFIKMMFIDGCFILQFIHCVVEQENGKLEMTDRQVALVKRDLLLIENQLPFPVLKSLMNGGHIGEHMIHHFLYLQVFSPDPREPIWSWVITPILSLIIYTVGMFGSMIKRLHLSDKISCCCHGLRICLSDSDQLPEQQREVQEASGSEEDNQPPERQSEVTSGEDNEPTHLLELLYSQLMESENGKGRYSKLIHGNTKRPPQVTSGHYLYYSAKNLKRIGIHFRPSLCGDLRDVEFNSSILFGTLKLPSIQVNESTKSLLLNLVAYEESTSPDHKWVASYICFMDSLINEAEDVEELRSKGILVNYLGADHEVADLFNEMGASLKPDASSSTYNEVKRKINKQCERRTSKWAAEWEQKYFGSPWTIIAVLAAAFGLALTATQTYYAKYSSCT